MVEILERSRNSGQSEDASVPFVKMIGLEFNNQVHYISSIEDFREVMAPDVYDALIKALDGGVIDNYESECEHLRIRCEELEDECNDLEYELEDSKNDLDSVTEKYEVLKNGINDLISRIYQGYIQQHDILQELEMIVSCN